MISVTKLRRVIRLADTGRVIGIAKLLATIIKEERKNGYQELR
jgi:hypothetical protein